MKKLFILILAVSLSTLGLAGCSGSSEPESRADVSKILAVPLTDMAARINIMPSDEEVRSTAAGTVLEETKIPSTAVAQSWFRIYEITEGDDVYQRISGKSFTPCGRIGLGDIRYLKVLHRNFDGQIQVGEIIVNARIADKVKEAFWQLYQQNYQIRKMHLVDDYYGQSKAGLDTGNAADWYSVNDDNTSAFNYRYVAHSSMLSRHALGNAIDLNPAENPQVTDGKAIDHPDLQTYAENRNQPHCIGKSDPAYQVFTSLGFHWLVASDTQDYQHFEMR